MKNKNIKYLICFTLLGLIACNAPSVSQNSIQKESAKCKRIIDFNYACETENGVYYAFDSTDTKVGILNCISNQCSCVRNLNKDLNKTPEEVILKMPPVINQIAEYYYPLHRSENQYISDGFTWMAKGNILSIRQENSAHKEVVYFGKEGLVNARIRYSVWDGRLNDIVISDYLELNLINSINPTYNLDTKNKAVYRLKCNETQLIQ